MLQVTLGYAVADASGTATDENQLAFVEIWPEVCAHDSITQLLWLIIGDYAFKFLVVATLFAVVVDVKSKEILSGSGS